MPTTASHGAPAAGERAFAPVTKTQRLRDLIADGDWPRALFLANTFRRLGPWRDTIRLAHECRVHPRFYRALGRDPDAQVAAGIAALKALYPPGQATRAVPNHQDAE